MKNRALLLTSILTLIGAPSYSQSIAESEGTFTITPTYVSSYMFRGVRLGGSAFQPTIEYSKGPLTLELFGSFPIDDKIPGSSDPELDLSASYTWSLTDIFSIKPGISLYTYPRADADDGFYKATCEPNVTFGLSLNDFTFSLNLYYDIVMKGATYEFGVDYSIPVKQLDLDIELSALVGTYDWSDSVNDSFHKTRNKGDYFQVGCSVPIEFSKRTKLVAGWYYQKGSNNYFREGNSSRVSNPDAIGRGVFSLGFSYSF